MKVPRSAVVTISSSAPSLLISATAKAEPTPERYVCGVSWGLLNVSESESGCFEPVSQNYILVDITSFLDMSILASISTRNGFPAAVTLGNGLTCSAPQVPAVRDKLEFGA